MEVHSNKTELKGRTLWYDGDNTVTDVTLVKILATSGKIPGLFVDAVTSAIEQYNQFTPPDAQILVKEYCRPLDFAWAIPTNFAEIDVRDYLKVKLNQEGETCGWSNTRRLARQSRVEHELDMFEKADLFGVIRTLIYIINTLQTNNIVWGVGRGSSVASYVLYLIGVHDVDSVEYGLRIEDFLRLE